MISPHDHLGHLTGQPADEPADAPTDGGVIAQLSFAVRPPACDAAVTMPCAGMIAPDAEGESDDTSRLAGHAERHATICRRPVTDLPGAIVAPAACAAADDRAGVVPTGMSLRHTAAQPAHHQPARPADDAAVAQLAGEIIAAAEQRAAGRSGTAMQQPGGHLGDAAVEPPHGDRSLAADGGAIAQLALGIAPPAKQCAGVVQYRTGMEPTGAHHRDIARYAAHQRRHAPIRPRGIAELAKLVLAPAQQIAIGATRAGVVLPRRNRRHIAQPRHDDRPRAVCDRAVTELAIVIVAPAAHGAVAEQGTGMPEPRRQLCDADTQRRDSLLLRDGMARRDGQQHQQAEHQQHPCRHMPRPGGVAPLNIVWHRRAPSLTPSRSADRLARRSRQLLAASAGALRSRLRPRDAKRGTVCRPPTVCTRLARPATGGIRCPLPSPFLS